MNLLMILLLVCVGFIGGLVLSPELNPQDTDFSTETVAFCNSTNYCVDRLVVHCNDLKYTLPEVCSFGDAQFSEDWVDGRIENDS